MTSNFRAKIFKQKMCFRAMICQYEVKIDIDAAVSFFTKKEDHSRLRPFLETHVAER